jgi:hypothetical protein
MHYIYIISDTSTISSDESDDEEINKLTQKYGGEGNEGHKVIVLFNNNKM